MPRVEHRQHQRRNNRAENAHQPTRERERGIRRFKDPGRAQRVLAAYGPIPSRFRPRRHRLTATAYRRQRGDAYATWRAVTDVAAAAGTAHLTEPSTSSGKLLAHRSLKWTRPEGDTMDCPFTHMLKEDRVVAMAAKIVGTGWQLIAQCWMRVGLYDNRETGGSNYRREPLSIFRSRSYLRCDIALMLLRYPFFKLI